MPLSALRWTAFSLLLAFSFRAQGPAGNADPLEVGKPLRREIAGGQVHAYQLRLPAEQYIFVAVAQRSVDVVVRFVAPDGRRLIEIDSPGGSSGLERLAFIAPAPGDYRIEVAPLQQGAPRGQYEIRWEDSRPATPIDRALVEARALVNQSFVLEQQGKWEEATRLAERAVSLREDALGKEHEDVAAALNRLGTLANLTGNAARAIEIHRRAMAIQERLHGAKSAPVAAAAHSIALIHISVSDYVAAEPLLQQALTILEAAGDENRGRLAQISDTLGGLYLRMGDFKKAEPFFLRGLELREKVFGPEQLIVAYSANNLGLLYDQMSAPEKARTFYQRSLGIKEKLYGANHPEIAVSLNNLGQHAIRAGDFEQARRSYRRAKEILEKRPGAFPLDLATALHGLAALELNDGRADEADSPLQQALSLRERALGPDHELVAKTLDSLFVLHMLRGDAARADGALRRSAEIAERILRRNLVIGSERRKLALLDQHSRNISKALSLHARLAPDDPRAREFALTLLLRFKGRTLDAMADAIARLRRRAAPEDQALFDQLAAARARLGTLTLRGPAGATIAGHQALVKQLEARLERLEEELSARSAEFKAESRPVTLADVQAALPAGAALVEFAQYAPYRTKDTPGTGLGARRYIAYVVAREGPPRWADLGEAARIDLALERFRAALRPPARSGFRAAARALDRAVMEPIRPLLGDARHVLLSPEGALNLLPFAALVDERGRYLIERYAFGYLTSGRDLLRPPSTEPPRDAPLIVANPAFGAATLAGTASQRGFGLAEVQFRPLPGTASEARALHRLLPEARVLTEERATESALKAAHGPRLLHIATHGFFLRDATLPAPPPAESRGLGLLANDAAPPSLENALLRSGLVLAGANLRRDSSDDGILTALELAGLDLQGTRLVVLSACNTGLGEIRRGEGVYGLRRALTLAGAESQVMSLWPVSDRATRDLMVAFYQGLQRGQNRTEAMRQVQLRMLQTGTRRHPYYWAGFIQTGAR